MDKFRRVKFSYILIDNLKFVFVSGLPSCALKTLSVCTSQRVFSIAFAVARVFILVSLPY
jgi:hypothetical protein